jgi:hypothetical protein
MLKHDLRVRRRAEPTLRECTTWEGWERILANSATDNKAGRNACPTGQVVVYLPKIMRPAEVLRTLVTLILTSLPTCSRPPSTTIMVPSSR